MPTLTTALRLWTALLVVVAGALTLSSSASAASASISFTDAAGNPDPVVDVGRTMTVSGNVPSPTRIYVLVRPAGGAPCAPSPNSDSGSTVYYGSFSGDNFFGTTVQGDYKLQKTGNWSTAGTFQFCTWLSPDRDTATSPITQILTFRRPTGTISATTSPLLPGPGTPITLSVSGNSEAPARAYAAVRPAGGAPCASSYGADTGTGIFSGRSVNGTFTVTDSYTPRAAGTYLVCLYLAQSSDDPNPIAVQPITFDVVAPLPPCIVPSISAGTSFSGAQSALQAAGCFVGGQTLQAHPKIGRGAVISATVSAGTSLPFGSGIGLVISDGRACKVPSSKAGLRLSKARSKLAALGCTAGSVRRVKSKRKKGTVVRFTPRAGTTLAPRAVVGITVSRGRR